MYSIEVNTRNGWGQLKPSGKTAKPYRFQTHAEATRIAQMCYPDQMRISNGHGEIRIVEVIDLTDRNN